MFDPCLETVYRKSFVIVELLPGGVTHLPPTAPPTTPPRQISASLRCAQTCTIFNAKPTCVCQQGYYLGSDKRSCFGKWNYMNFESKSFKIGIGLCIHSFGFKMTKIVRLGYKLNVILWGKWEKHMFTIITFSRFTSVNSPNSIQLIYNYTTIVTSRFQLLPLQSTTLLKLL